MRISCLLWALACLPTANAISNPAQQTAPQTHVAPQVTSPSSNADSVQVLSSSLPHGTHLKRGQASEFQVVLRYSLQLTDTALLVVYIEEFPSGAGGCSGAIHRTNGGAYTVIKRGEGTVTLDLKWPGEFNESTTDDRYDSGYASFGANLWTSSPTGIPYPGKLVKRIGLFPDFCNAVEGQSKPAPTQEKRPESIFRAGKGSIGYPTCMYCPEPQYSEEARKAKYQGTVVLQVVITADGRADKITVVKSPGLGLELAL